VSLFLYLAGCLHQAIDDLHRLNPSETGSAADMFDRFLGWPARHTAQPRRRNGDLGLGSRQPVVDDGAASTYG
jgi:hypothetical protein